MMVRKLRHHRVPRGPARRPGPESWRLRVTEGNSVACAGAAGVSDAPVAALWRLTCSSARARGRRGMNFHNAGARYDVMDARRSNGAWSAHVTPLCTGCSSSSARSGPDAHLLDVRGARPSRVKVWATIDAHAVRRVLVLNKDAARAHVIRLRVGPVARAVVVSTLSAAGGDAPVLNGRQFEPWVTDLRPAASPGRVIPLRAGVLAISVPRLAALVVALAPAADASSRAPCPLRQRLCVPSLDT